MGYPILVTISAFAAIVGIRSVRHRALFRSLYRTAGRYLPPARLVTLARSGFADPLDGHERDVSILLVDLAGFTSFSNRPDLSASDIVRMANRYFTLMQGIIDRHGGCSDKFLGDAVLAFWNGLADEPDHALKALAAAAEIISAIGHAKESEDNLLAARAIVCSGKVYVGDLGAKQRSNFTIIGPAVNETFRLEKVPDIYGLSLLVAGSASEMIQASNSSMQSIGLLENNVLVRIDDVELKGFDGVRPIYTLVPKDDPGLADFRAARNALDRKMYGEAMAHLKAVDSGMLQLAAKTLLRQVDPVPMRAREGGGCGATTPRM
jgi:class 3 adenylate cyclase